MRWGESASRDMHLAAAVYCEVCDMMVELGTEDCPHAIQLEKSTEVKMKTEAQIRERLNTVRNELDLWPDSYPELLLRVKAADVMRGVVKVLEWVLGEEEK